MYKVWLDIIIKVIFYSPGFWWRRRAGSFYKSSSDSRCYRRDFDGMPKIWQFESLHVKGSPGLKIYFLFFYDEYASIWEERFYKIKAIGGSGAKLQAQIIFVSNFMDQSFYKTLFRVRTGICNGVCFEKVVSHSGKHATTY